MCDLYQGMLLDHDLSEETRVMDQVPGNLGVGWKAPRRGEIQRRSSAHFLRSHRKQFLNRNDPSPLKRTSISLQQGEKPHYGDEIDAVTAIRQRSTLPIEEAALPARLFYHSCHRFSVATIKIKQEDHFRAQKKNPSYSGSPCSV
jgi:hypothetical protein